MRQAIFVLLVLTVSAVSHAQDGIVSLGQTAEIGPLPREMSLKPVPQAVYQQSVEYVFPELIVGGEWTSTIKLTNWSNNPIPRTNVYFVDNVGNPMRAAFRTVSCTITGGCTNGNLITDTGFSFSLTTGVMIELTFFGGSNTQFGHALVDICSATGTCSSAGLYAEVILKNTNSTRPDFESVFPLEQPTPQQYMMWDHRNGVSTVLYLVNPNTTVSTVTVTVVNQVNQTVGTTTLSMRPAESQLIPLTSLFPATIGLQGTLRVTGSNGSGNAVLVATGLRINPSNSFTPLRAYVPSR